ncbi:MAG TPA: alginate export family protein [Dissulfurispiraceae bacterium]|nr:alginate export family protein [Dissulfurispiraceae bacterium]
MKKYTSILLSIMLVLGCAAMAFAVPADIPADTTAAIAKGGTRVTIDGDIRVRGRMFSNVGDFNSDVRLDGDNSFYDSRVRLGVTAQVTPNTMGRILLESGSATSDTYTWGAASTTSAARGTLGGTYGPNNPILAGESKPEIRILEAWLQHKGSGLLGVPAFIKAGHMPIRVSNGLFYSHTYMGDDAILVGVEPVKSLSLIFHTLQLREGDSWKSDDTTAYGVIGSYAVDKKSTIGFDVTYVDAQNSFPPTVNYDLHLWNFGVNAKTNISGFGLAADLAIQTGKVDDRPGAADVKMKGYAVKLDADYTFDPVKIGVGFGYGSGDDATSTNYKTFATSQDVALHYTWVYERWTPNAAGKVNGGLQNTWYLTAKASADLTKEVYADLSIWYLRAAKAYYGDLLTFGGGVPTTSKNIGVEVDANIKYKLDKNLTYFVEAGYLFAGKFWDDAVRGGQKADDAYAVRHGVQLSF